MENSYSHKISNLKNLSEEEKKQRCLAKSREARKLALKELNLQRNSVDTAAVESDRRSNGDGHSEINQIFQCNTRSNAPNASAGSETTLNCSNSLAGMESCDQLTNTKLQATANIISDCLSNQSYQDLNHLDLKEQSSSGGVTEHSQTASVFNTAATEAKLSSILDYLDQVERQTGDLSKEETTEPNQDLGDIEETSTEITSEMLKLKLDFEEKKKNIALLETALAQQKQFMQRSADSQYHELTRQITMQKQQYEATIQRHLAFIDQLIDDKKLLNDKCEHLVGEMKQLDEKYQRKIKTLCDSHHVELKQVKENILASEKIYREQWVKEKTHRIKEITVKGLEPEIEKLIQKHKDELKGCRMEHAAEITKLNETLESRFARWKEDYRSQVEREKESLCKREEEMAREKYEQQIESLEVSLQQQRRKMFEDIAKEREELRQWAMKKENEVEVTKMQLEGSNSLVATSLRAEFDKRAAEQELQHDEQLRNLQRKLDSEKQAWQESFVRNQAAVLQQKEKELREVLRIDRDKEINLVVRRLEEEMQHQREELEQSTENRIKRVRNKYETEISEVEKSEKGLQDKCSSLKATLNEIHDQNEALKSNVHSKEQEIIKISNMKEKLAAERSCVTEVVRKEFEDRLQAAEDDVRTYKHDLDEARIEWRSEVDMLKKTNEKELAEVHERVKHTIEKKDETIGQLRMQFEAACKRADHLEGLFEQQRNKLLGKRK